MFILSIPHPILHHQPTYQFCAYHNCALVAVASEMTPILLLLEVGVMLMLVRCTTISLCCMICALYEVTFTSAI